MKIGLHLIARPDREGDGATEFASRVALADSYGFDRITTGDVQGNHLECFTALTYMACLTKRAAVGPLTTHGVTRDPGVAAAAIASLAAIADGRVFFVLGRGDGSVRNVGLAPATVAETRDYFLAVRGLLHTGAATYRGRRLKLAWPSSAPRRVKLYMVAEGPRMLDLAGALADGVYVGAGLLPEVIDATLDRLRAAAAEAGRDPAELDVWWATRCSVAATEDEAIRAVRESLSSMGNHALRGDYAAKLVPDGLFERLTEYHARYDYNAKNSLGAGSLNADVMDELGLTPYFLDRFGIVGTPDQIVVRLEALRGRGIERIHLGAEGSDDLDLLGRSVLPRLAG